MGLLGVSVSGDKAFKGNWGLGATGGEQKHLTCSSVPLRSYFSYRIACIITYTINFLQSVYFFGKYLNGIELCIYWKFGGLVVNIFPHPITQCLRILYFVFLSSLIEYVLSQKGFAPLIEIREYSVIAIKNRLPWIKKWFFYFLDFVMLVTYLIFLFLHPNLKKN